MNFTISEEQQSAQQLAQQILSDFTDVDKLKFIEQPQKIRAALGWAFTA